MAGLPVAGGGVPIPFEDGHVRHLPVLTTSPFRPATQATADLDAARRETRGDDTSTSRDMAFAKITARVKGTAAAASRLGV